MTACRERDAPGPVRSHQWHSFPLSDKEIALINWLSPPINGWLAGGLLIFMVLSAVMGVRRFTCARRTEGLARAQWFVRAMRCLLIGITAGAWAAGFYWQQSWLLIIGLVVLGQELYEGAVLGAVLRRGRRMEAGRGSCR